jgi:hypothetical protein
MSAAYSHASYWLVRELFSQTAEASAFINIRAIANQRPYTDNEGRACNNGTRVVFNENIPIIDFKSRWPILLNHLTMLNQQEEEPANIYFGVNPRTSLNAAANKVADVAGYQAFYLDCDDNKSYTKEQRLIQADFWNTCNLNPSIVIDSGHGYHVYWLFENLLSDKTRGQNILRHMVRTSGCRDKGNTHDPTRILRLPGFYNVKEWFKGDMPLCGIVQPTNWTAQPQMLRYDPAVFENHWPPSDLQDIERYNQSAMTQDASVPFADRIRNTAREAARVLSEQKAQLDGRTIAENSPLPDATLKAQMVDTATVEPLKLTLNTVPPLEHINWARGQVWMKAYCLRGYDGLTIDEQIKIKNATQSEDLSASELDYRIMYRLISLGFTYAAINEFWHRNGVRLYRADKEKKNPNYIKMTFDKAFSAAEATLQQGKNAKKTTDRLIVTPNNLLTETEHGLVIRRTESKDELILTGNLILLARYHDETAEDESEREWFDLRITGYSPNGPVVVEKLVSCKAFNTIDRFLMDVCGPHCRFLSNKRSELQAILSYLEYKYPKVPVKRFSSKLTYKNGIYNFPQMRISASSIETKQDALVTELFTSRYPIYGWFEPNCYTPEQARNFLQNNLKDLLQLHLPRLIAGVLGLIGSAAIAVRFRETFTNIEFNLPTINVRGASSSGKTETLKLLSRLCGIVSGRNTMSTDTSRFAMQRHISSTTFLPVIIDEFKLNSDGSNLKNLLMIRDIVRRNYSGEAIMRGRADTSIVSFRMHAPMIVIGEHQLETVGDVSETSRVFAIDTDTYQIDVEKLSRHQRIQNQRWEWIAPLFYQYVLTLDENTLYAEYLKIEKRMRSSLEKNVAESLTRMSHNLASLYLGCNLWSRFFKSLCPSAPDVCETLDLEKCLLEDTMEMYLNNKNTFVGVAKTHAGVETRVVVTNNEFFTMLQTIQDIEESGFAINDVTTKCFYEKEAENELLIVLPAMHERYALYLQRKNRTAPERTKMLSLIKAMQVKQSPLLLECHAARKLDGRTVRVYVMDLNLLRTLGIWRKNENPVTITTPSKLLN